MSFRAAEFQIRGILFWIQILGRLCMAFNDRLVTEIPPFKRMKKAKNIWEIDQRRIFKKE